MTKGELLRILEPFTDETEIMTLGPGNDKDTLSIKHARYFIFDGISGIVLCPMGCHLQTLIDEERNELWNRK